MTGAGKEFLSAAAMVLTFVAFLPYIRKVWRGSARPHVFSWIIWTLTTLIVFFAQLAAHGGAGAWAVGVSGIITAGIAVLACRRNGDLRATRVDWAFLVAALSALPLWFFTRDPLWAVVILTTVDMLGFGPTIRQAHAHPRSESAGFYGLFAIRNLLVILALEQYSMTTVLFPAAVGAGCLFVSGLLLAMRR